MSSGIQARLAEAEAPKRICESGSVRPTDQAHGSQARAGPQTRVSKVFRRHAVLLAFSLEVAERPTLALGCLG